MSVEKQESLGASPDKENLEDPELLTAGELDARYMKLLRMQGEGEMEYYEMRWRFKGEDGEETLWFGGCASTSSAIDYNPLELKIAPTTDPEDICGVEYRRIHVEPGKKYGRLSRSILHPEGSEREQPLKMRKSKKSSDAGAPGAKSDLWTSSDYYAITTHETYVDNIMKDLILYLIFLIITNMVTFGVLDRSFNYYANVLSEIITESEFETELGISKTFNQIRNVEQIWDFIKGSLLTVLYEYGNSQKRSIRRNESDILVLFENILIGVPRIRQQRVRNDSCKTDLLFQDLFSTCYNYYSDDLEDKEPFGNRMPNAWTYTEPDEESASYDGKISSYGGGGYMMNITTDKAYTNNWIAELIQDEWITKGTRVVFIDFTSYTPNTNSFCIVKLVFELPPTGGVIPTAHFKTMSFLRYVNTWDHFVLGCEIIFVCYIVYFTMEELQQMKSLKEDYWSSSWNMLDIAILLVAYVLVIAGCVRYVTIRNGMKEKVSHIASGSHASFDNFVHVQRTFNILCGVLAFLVWLKLLKFAALNKNVALVLSTFGRVKYELIALTLMMTTMVIAFALLGNTLFGTHVEQFNTISNSLFSLIGIFVGGLYFYMSCANASPILAPIFFVSYIYFVLILFLNAYVALFMDGFHKALEEFDDKRDRVFLGDICRTITYRTLNLFEKNDLANKIRNKKVAYENKKDYEDILKIVKKHGFRGLDITMLLKKHNIAPGAPVPFEKMSKLYNEIDPKNQLMLEVSEHDKLMEQVDSTISKLETIDKTTAEVMHRVDVLVSRLLYDEDKVVGMSRN